MQPTVAVPGDCVAAMRLLLPLVERRGREGAGDACGVGDADAAAAGGEEGAVRVARALQIAQGGLPLLIHEDE